MVGKSLGNLRIFCIWLAECLGLDFWWQPELVTYMTLHDKQYVPAEMYATHAGIELDLARRMSLPLYLFIFEVGEQRVEEVQVSAEQYAKYEKGATIGVLFRKGRWDKSRRSYTGIT